MTQTDNLHHQTYTSFTTRKSHTTRPLDAIQSKFNLTRNPTSQQPHEKERKKLKIPTIHQGKPTQHQPRPAATIILFESELCADHTQPISDLTCSIPPSILQLQGTTSLRISPDDATRPSSHPFLIREYFPIYATIHPACHDNGIITSSNHRGQPSFLRIRAIG